VRSLDHVTYF